MGKNTTNDMTQGNCMRLLVQFFLPILAGNLFQQLYSFADSMVVGKGIGDTALAAVGNTGSVHFLIIGFAIGLTGGLGICISQSFGSGNYEKLRKELAMSVWICLAIGIVITVVSLAFMRQLFTFLHTPEDLMTETLQYFGTILAGTTITIFNNFAMTLLRSVGNSRVPLVAMIISAVANVLMDLLFVFPLHMGVFGAALATVLAQVLSALYCCYYIGREKNLIPKKNGLETTECNHQKTDIERSACCRYEFCHCSGWNGIADICQQYGNKLCGCLCGMHQDPQSF